MDHVHDVAVIGGGPIGAVFARALARGGADVVLVEATSPTAAAPVADARPIALGIASMRILETLGAWAPLATAAAPIRRIHVSDRGRFGFVRMRAADYGLEALGYVVDAGLLGSALHAAAVGDESVRALCPARVTDAAVEGAAARLEVEEPGPGRRLTVHARLLVVADGGRSRLREALGIGAERKEYGQVAIVARVRPARHHRDTAYERFTAGGPLAMLPMAGGRCGLVWSVPAGREESILALPDEEFLALLRETFGGRLGDLVETGPRAAHPLALVRAHELARPRVVVAGNAAQLLHPVAGQGLNLGLRDAAALAETVLAALRAGRDPGATEVLGAYARGRRGDRRAISTFTDTVVGVFSRPALPIAAVRDAGLVALDLLPPLKRAFVLRATGLGGRQSRLARGLAP